MFVGCWLPLLVVATATADTVAAIATAAASASHHQVDRPCLFLQMLLVSLLHGYGPYQYSKPSEVTSIPYELS